MKKLFFPSMLLLAMIGTSCNDSTKTTSESNSDSTSTSGNSAATGSTTSNNASYVDLNTGQTIQLQMDDKSQVTTDAITGKPVKIYVNTITSDTFDTKGRLVNNALIHNDAGWDIDETKIKSDGDESKMKSDDMKIKTDGEDVKVKTDEGKAKMDGNDSKVKTDDVKIKNDNGEIKVKDK